MARKPSTPAKQRALALVRISDDREDTRLGVGRQEEDCRALAERNGWTLTEVIVENDTSAYQTKLVRDPQGLPRRVTIRPEFERALTLLNEGQAEALIVYAQDRLARQPHDLERVIDLATHRGVLVVSYIGGLDLTNTPGITQARIQAAIAWQSSADTARRVARAAKAAAEQGRAKGGGFRPYGYEPGCVAIREDEAAVVREVAERILLGDTLTGIARDLNARGVPTVAATEWRPPSLRSIVSKPTVAGLRSYRGEVVAEGDWPPILDRGTWETVRALLAGRRRGAGHSTSRHLLTGIARCGVEGCGAPLNANRSRRSGDPIYRCSACNGIARRQAPIDDYVTGFVQRLLEQDSVQRARRRQTAGRPGRALVQLQGLRERRKQILRDFAVRLDADDLAEMLGAVDERIAALEAETTAGGSGLALPKAKDFAGLPLERRRAIIRALVRVTVRPARLADDGCGVDVQSLF